MGQEASIRRVSHHRQGLMPAERVEMGVKRKGHSALLSFSHCLLSDAAVSSGAAESALCSKGLNDISTECEQMGILAGRLSRFPGRAECVKSVRSGHPACYDTNSTFAALRESTPADVSQVVADLKNFASDAASAEAQRMEERVKAASAKAEAALRDQFLKLETRVLADLPDGSGGDASGGRSGSKATGKMGTVTLTNGHAVKVLGTWWHAEEVEPLPYMGSGPYHARFQQTMLRIKDPKRSIPFYEENFGMKLIHWIEFPEFKFTVYFLERPREGQTVPACSMEKTTIENEKYLWTMSGSTLELTHNHGEEMNDNFKVWNGNVGRDGEGANYADEPAARGFGHVAFNCDDVYEACERLEKNGVKFQKKPDEGRMKGLAFALDPDGYWIEIVRREKLGWKEYYNLSQTMLRVKDGPASVEFYTKHLGMTLLRKVDFPQYKFSLYFLASLTPAELAECLPLDPENKHAGGLNPEVPNALTKIAWSLGTSNSSLTVAVASTL
ncbi:GLO1 [Symbiodinium sp. CCMP2592]|nr:GLO1 [Symbiodinium sp. CCMP2592]